MTDSFRYTADIKDRIFSILGLSTHNTKFLVDYRLNTFYLFLETLWFAQVERGSGRAAAKALTLLNLTPEMMAWYACAGLEKLSGPWSKGPPRISKRTEELYLRSASSSADQMEWLQACSVLDDGTKRWTFSPNPQQFNRGLHFPPKSDWEAHLCYDSSISHINFSVAVYSTRLDASDFLSHRLQTCLLRGVSKTRCTPNRVTVLFVLAEA